MSFVSLKLNALDLSKNRLQRLDLYSTLREKCPNLQIIDLSDNQVGYPGPHPNPLRPLYVVLTVFCRDKMYM